MALEESEAAEQKRAPSDFSRFISPFIRFLARMDFRKYATGVLPYICPALTNMLTHQEEDADDEEWNPAKAAGVCLMNLASCCEGTLLITQMLTVYKIFHVFFCNRQIRYSRINKRG